MTELSRSPQPQQMSGKESRVRQLAPSVSSFCSRIFSGAALLNLLKRESSASAQNTARSEDSAPKLLDVSLISYMFELLYNAVWERDLIGELYTGLGGAYFRPTCSLRVLVTEVFRTLLKIAYNHRKYYQQPFPTFRFSKLCKTTAVLLQGNRAIHVYVPTPIESSVRTTPLIYLFRNLDMLLLSTLPLFLAKISVHSIHRLLKDISIVDSCTRWPSVYAEITDCKSCVWCPCWFVCAGWCSQCYCQR